MHLQCGERVQSRWSGWTDGRRWTAQNGIALGRKREKVVCPGGIERGEEARWKVAEEEEGGSGGGWMSE